MAQKLRIQNNSGQALTETLFLLGLTCGCLLFLLQCLLKVIFSVALDAALEDYFYCELAAKDFCLPRLEQRLHDNQLREISIKVQKLPQKITVAVSATHFASISATREFNYEYYRQKF